MSITTGAADRIRRVLNELPGLELQPRTMQSRFQDLLLLRLRARRQLSRKSPHLHQQELTANVFVSFGQFLDIVPVARIEGPGPALCRAETRYSAGAYAGGRRFRYGRRHDAGQYACGRGCQPPRRGTLVHWWIRNAFILPTSPMRPDCWRPSNIMIFSTAARFPNIDD